MNSKTQICISLSEFFNEQVSQALGQRKVKTYPLVEKYLVDLLQFYTSADNLYEEQEGKKRQTTLAELYLKAMSESSQTLRFDLLKKLGDTSLYISGFFGDSLKRKIVDVDYYAEIGGRAYHHLSVTAPEDTYCKVFDEIANRFLDFVDVLTLVSQRAMIQTNEDLLRLYDRYITTGSELAKDQLLEKGLLPTPSPLKKSQ